MSMYFKLMVRSLLRHQKRGRKLFVLLALCSAALTALLTFQADFTTQYQELFVGIKTGHLQVLPRNAAVFSTGFGSREQEVPLLRADTLDAWVKAQPEVEEAAPVINRYGMAYNLDSESESWVSLVAVPADRLSRLFPLAKIVDGQFSLDWKPGDAEVPMLHARLQNEFGQRNADTTKFLRKELKAANDQQFKAFQTKLAADFPTLVKADTSELQFLDAWSSHLGEKELYKSLPASRLADYDYRIDDALAAIEANRLDSMVSFLNKRLFLALYPDDIHFLQEPIVPGKSVTLQVPGLKNEGSLTLPKVIPARYSGLVEIMPLYTPDSYVDLDAFRSYTDVEPNLATGYVIRLKHRDDTAVFQTKVETWLKQHPEVGDVRVADYLFLGKLYLTTSMAFGVIIGILIGVFVLILVIFIVNLVLMSLIQRRREIGTGIAMGLTSAQTIAVMLGEIGVIVTVSWAAGSLIAFLANGAASLWGIPGMIFFPGQRLHLTQQVWPYVLAYLILLPSALISAVLPLSGLRKLMPVDYFREAR